MSYQPVNALPAGPGPGPSADSNGFVGRRDAPAGLAAGAPLSRIDGPAAALALVAPELRRVERRLQELVLSDVAAIPEVGGYLLEAGGKRLRPALAALGARALGVSGRVGLMCVGELIHLGSLLHDDVVDEAETRRGRPAAHRVFGNAVVVLGGDFCLARAVLLAAEEGGPQAATALARAVTEMAEGEVLQLQRAGDLSCTREAYHEVVDRKSAALIGFCAASHAWAEGRGGEAQLLDGWGRSIGRAFQITDDVLDYLPGTGKVAGADLRERKVTLPLLLAMERVDGLRARLEQGPLLASELPVWVDRVRASGALEAALGEARQVVAQASARLGVLPSSEGVEALRVLGRYLVERAS